MFKAISHKPNTHTNTHTILTVLFPFWGQLAADSHYWECSRRQPEGLKTSRAETQPLSHYSPKWNQMWTCVCVSLRSREEMLHVRELCVSWCVCACVSERECVKLLHSTLGLLPNACHPACPLPPAHPSLALKKRKTLKKEKRAEEDKTGKRTVKRKKRSASPQTGQVRTRHTHRANFYQSCSPCCGHNAMEGFSKSLTILNL